MLLRNTKIDLHLARSFWRDDRGATALEYALLAALIFLAILATVRALGGELNSTFENIDSELDTANNL